MYGERLADTERAKRSHEVGFHAERRETGSTLLWDQKTYLLLAGFGLQRIELSRPLRVLVVSGFVRCPEMIPTRCPIRWLA